MLLVVLGAGASYDSYPTVPPGKRDLPYRPPLTDGLFIDRPEPEYRQIVARLPALHPALPRLQRMPSDGTLETELRVMQEEGDRIPARLQQIAAVRYYLHVFLPQWERKWAEITRGITNHAVLLDQIFGWQGKSQEPVCLATFNYDRMLESALGVYGFTFKTLDDYVRHEHLRYLKLHGSVNWVREVEGREALRNSPWETTAELIRRAPTLHIADRYGIAKESHTFLDWPVGIQEERSQPLQFPAIAIPVETKRHFECPQEHLAVLRKSIPEARKVVFIGWRARERHFLEYLASLPADARIMIVTGSPKGASEVEANLNSAQPPIPGERVLVPSGFTGAGDGAIQRFLWD